MFGYSYSVPNRKKKQAPAATRDPARTRERILAAALDEFASRGFAGARVDAIARRARINKRMLYHYFRDKSGLFRAVIRHMISTRVASLEAQSPGNDFVSTMPLWFKQNCVDADWVRLLAWESLQTQDKPVCEEAKRRRLTAQTLAKIKQKQAKKILRKDVSAVHLLLAKVSLTMFPLAMPQIARIIIGCSPQSPKFQREYARFLETISAMFRP